MVTKLRTRHGRRRRGSRATTALLTRARTLRGRIHHGTRVLHRQRQSLHARRRGTVRRTVTTTGTSVTGIVHGLRRNAPATRSTRQTARTVSTVTRTRLPAQRPGPIRPGPKFGPRINSHVHVPDLNRATRILATPSSSRGLAIHFNLVGAAIDLTSVRSLRNRGTRIPIGPGPRSAMPTTRTTPSTPTIHADHGAVSLQNVHITRTRSILRRSVTRTDNTL